MECGTEIGVIGGVEDGYPAKISNFCEIGRNGVRWYGLEYGAESGDLGIISCR